MRENVPIDPDINDGDDQNVDGGAPVVPEIADHIAVADIPIVPTTVVPSDLDNLKSMLLDASSKVINRMMVEISQKYGTYRDLLENVSTEIEIMSDEISVGLKNVGEAIKKDFALVEVCKDMTSSFVDAVNKKFIVIDDIILTAPSGSRTKSQNQDVDSLLTNIFAGESSASSEDKQKKIKLRGGTRPDFRQSLGMRVEKKVVEVPEDVNPNATQDDEYFSSFAKEQLEIGMDF